MEKDLDIVQLINRGGILTNVGGNTPQEVYKNISTMIKLPEGTNAEQVCSALCAREGILTTAVGNGIALPHARTPIVQSEDDSMIVVVYLKEPIEMKAPDERPVSTMFVLLTQNSQVHLKILSTLAGLFRSLRFRKALDEHADLDALSSLINDL